MKKNRTIKTIVYAATMDMGGMPVRQGFPSAKAEQIDPFLLLHHAELKVPTHLPVQKLGVGGHPHRGFSPVTFIFKGGVHHRDSRGNDNVVYAGGTQWMNAGMGVVHSERPPADIYDIGGVQELIQLWVNTPAAHKMDIPTYQPLTKEDTPFVTNAQQSVRVNIHSGELDGIIGKIKTLSPVNTFTAEIKAGVEHTINIPEGHNAFIYVLHGKIMGSGDEEVEENFVAIFNNDGEGLHLHALADSILLIGSGMPLNEPVASHGPFVMNSQTEIMEAFRDYQMGKMGVLIED